MCRLTDDEISAVHQFVADGGGILVLGTYTGDWHHEANLNKLLVEYGIALKNNVVTKSSEDGFKQGPERSVNSPCSVEARPVTGGDGAAGDKLRNDLLREVSSVSMLSACSLYVQRDLATPLLETTHESVVLEPVPEGQGICIMGYQQAGQGPAIVAAASKTHKVVVVGTWKVFLDEFIDSPNYQNGQFYTNLLEWLMKAQ